MSQTLVATFYKFVPLPTYTERQHPLLDYCLSLGLKGTILLAEEGINATVAGEPEAIAALMRFLKADACFADLTHRESFAPEPPFERMRVRVRPEIVTMGLADVNPRRQVGTYVTPADWNTVIRDPETTIIDTRNHYEVKIGSFQGAIDPNLKKFREFPDYVVQNLDPQKHRKIAMFCTGGIRCEKASSFLLDKGFEQVYHLQGGILNYLEQVPAEQSLWTGECFVFDDRVAVQHGLELGHYEMCQACGHPINAEDKADPHYQAGLSCPYCQGRFSHRKYGRI